MNKTLLARLANDYATAFATEMNDTYGVQTRMLYRTRSDGDKILLFTRLMVSSTSPAYSHTASAHGTSLPSRLMSIAIRGLTRTVIASSSRPKLRNSKLP